MKIEEKPVPIAPVEPRIVVKNPKLQEISRDDVSSHPLCLESLTFNYSTLKVTSSGEETIETFHCICQKEQQDNWLSFCSSRLWAGERLLLVRIFSVLR